METNPKCPVSQGLWNRSRLPPNTKERQAMLDLMAQESRLINSQRNRINQSLKRDAVLPNDYRADSSLSVSESFVARRPYASGKRTAEACRAGNSYSREKYRPSATRDLEKEKKKLQDIFSMGSEAPPPAPAEEKPPQEKDRYEEVLGEIIERKRFLADMAALGQERDYIEVINSQISQKMRELDLLCQQRAEKTRSEAPEGGEH